MERLDLEKLQTVEEKVTTSINLLDVAKSYCEFHCNKSDEIVAMNSMLEVILNNEKELAKELDKLAM